MSKVFKYLIFTIVSVFLLTPPVATVTALSDAYIDKFAENNIVFYDPSSPLPEESPYDPCAGGGAGGGGAETLPGNSQEERVWNYFVNAGIAGVSTEAAVIAGIMGNLQQESGFNPFSHRSGSPYYGIYQTSVPEFKQMIDNKGWSSYWGTTNAPDDVVNEATKLELDFLTQQNERWLGTGWASRFGFMVNLNSPTNKSPESYAELFEVSVEGAVTSNTSANNTLLDQGVIAVGTGSFSRAAGGGRYYQEVGTRRNYARAIYDRYSTNAPADPADPAAPAAPAASSEDGTRITLIGDSIAEGTKAKFLEVYPNTDVHTQVSKQFYGSSKNNSNPQGNFILEDLKNGSQLRKILIYALGTNNSALTESEAQNIVNSAGSDTTILFITNYSKTTDFTSNNNVLRKMKADNSNVVLVEWESAVKGDPDKYLSDGIHPNADGIELWVSLVSAALNSTSTSDSLNGCGGGGGGGSTVDGVTTYTYDGNTYAFPLAGATKANVLNGRNSAGASSLSPLPCSNYSGCHHDSPAVDTGLRATMAGYESKAGNYGASDDNMMYFSTGVKVVALVAGKITHISGNYNGVSDCASISYLGNDGRNYWIGHTYLNPDLRAGDTFTVGQDMTVVHTPQCALGTQAHIHVNTSNGTCTRSDRSGCTKDAIDIINAGFDALPEN